MKVTEHFTPEGLPYLEIRGCSEFVPAHIFECGQCFRWNRLDGSDNTYIGVAGGRVLAVSTSKDASEDEAGNVITFANTDAAQFESFWKQYFDFGRDYAAIQNELSEKDQYLKMASAYGRGIRILRQEPFETLISFILSANNNIPRIKGCVEKLSAAYGERIEISEAFKAYLSRIPGVDQGKIPSAFYAFPTPERMSCVTADEISVCCKAGYRCAYIEKTSRMYIEQPLDSDTISSAALEDARKMLRAYTGVGPKVADCVLLFAGLRTDVFPVDVWVRRVLEKLYFKREITVPEACSFVDGHFGPLAGFAQQYLFYGMRENPSIFDEI